MLEHPLAYRTTGPVETPRRGVSTELRRTLLYENGRWCPAIGYFFVSGKYTRHGMLTSCAVVKVNSLLFVVPELLVATTR